MGWCAIPRRRITSLETRDRLVELTAVDAGDEGVPFVSHLYPAVRVPAHFHPLAVGLRIGRLEPGGFLHAWILSVLYFTCVPVSWWLDDVAGHGLRLGRGDSLGVHGVGGRRTVASAAEVVLSSRCAASSPVRSCVPAFTRVEHPAAQTTANLITSQDDHGPRFVTGTGRFTRPSTPRKSQIAQR